jgi:aromatic ring-opening dioxygenase LigB subunit
MPHAPVLVPDVGRDALESAAASAAALQAVAGRLVERSPAAVVLISPHSPRKPRAFGVWTGDRLRGSFAGFGAPEAAVDLRNDLALVAELEAQARRAGLQTWQIPPRPLDHGALVPLWYLAEAGWTGAVAILSLNYPGEGNLAGLGRVIAGAANALGEQIAVVASGDMSHRLTFNAPGGYEPRARDFDRRFIAQIRGGDYSGLEQFDPELQELAGEDALDATRVALAAISGESVGHEVLSYEEPFGVGYGVAVLFDSSDPQPQDFRRPKLFGREDLCSNQ